MTRRYFWEAGARTVEWRTTLHSYLHLEDHMWGRSVPFQERSTTFCSYQNNCLQVFSAGWSPEYLTCC